MNSNSFQPLPNIFIKTIDFIPKLYYNKTAIHIITIKANHFFVNDELFNYIYDSVYHNIMFQFQQNELIRALF